jgi:Cys-rich four helix bundle protein (predicted Tat secretion target)
MNRREALLSTGSMVVSASLGAIACGTRNAVAQAPHVHPETDAALIDAAFDCSKKGNACIFHCLHLLSSGDASMAGCASAVNDMVAVTDALAKVASHGGKHVAAVARLAIDVCKDCEAECRKHAEHHAVCKDCADSCQRTIAACQKVAG